MYYTQLGSSNYLCQNRSDMLFSTGNRIFCLDTLCTVYPPPPLARIGNFRFFYRLFSRGGGHNWEKKFCSLFTCFGAFTSFLSYKCFSSRKNRKYIGRGVPPPPSIGKRPIYFRVFLLKASLNQNS